jgi:circadian clock protein KaiC
VTLEQLPVEYGGDRRRLRVAKLRGATFRSGHHDFTLRTGGLCVFPRLVAAEHRGAFVREPLSTGVDGLDALLGGGVDRGTATLVVGPAGTGKSTVAAQVMAAAAARGERVAAFVFEESQGTLVARAEALGIDLRGPLEAGTLSVRHVDPAELAPDEFAYAVRGAVEAGARVVAIDSLTGYFNAMPEARFLTLQLHELLTYLQEKGVVTLLTLAQHGLVGGPIASPIDVSYLADTVLLIRYFESQGRVRKAISVVKKRTGVHEDAIRELTLAPGSLRVGASLTDFQSVLTGVPTFSGAREDLDRVSRD